MFLAFIRVHILYHAKNEAFFGLWMIDELKSHGYKISPGTLYPILHSLEKDELLKVTKKVVEGKERKYYSITDKGKQVLEKCQEKIGELFKEVID